MMYTVHTIEGVGTNTERLAYDTDTLVDWLVWNESDTGETYKWNGTSWEHMTAAGGGTGDHNDLSGLQGGDTDEYYHMTENQHTEVTTFFGSTDITGGQAETLTDGSSADSLHTHTGSSLSGIDISDDTNLEVTSPIVLTDDTISIQDASADSSTKGAATFDSDDFDATNGKIDLADEVVKTFSTDSGSGTPTSHTIVFVGGEGIDTSGSSNSVVIVGEDASDTNKGIATFNDSYFTVTSGDVTIDDIYVLNSGDTMTGDLHMDANDLYVGDDDDLKITSDGSVTLEVQATDKDLLLAVSPSGTGLTAIQIHGDSGIISRPKQSRVGAYQDVETAQNISDSTVTVVSYDTEMTSIADNHGEYNTANYRFTPDEAGWYMVTAGLELDDGGSWGPGEEFWLYLYKDGSLYSVLDMQHAIEVDGEIVTKAPMFARGTCLVYLDSSYIDVRAYQDSGAIQQVAGGSEHTSLHIHRFS